MTSWAVDPVWMGRLIEKSILLPGIDSRSFTSQRIITLEVICASVRETRLLGIEGRITEIVKVVTFRRLAKGLILLHIYRAFLFFIHTSSF